MVLGIGFLYIETYLSMVLRFSQIYRMSFPFLCTFSKYQLDLMNPSLWLLDDFEAHVTKAQCYTFLDLSTYILKEKI